MTKNFHMSSDVRWQGDRSRSAFQLALITRHFFASTGHDHCQLLILPIHRGMARLSWPGWLIKYQDGMNATQTHKRSHINRVWCRVTMLTETNVVPQSRTTIRNHHSWLLKVSSTLCMVPNASHFLPISWFSGWKSRHLWSLLYNLLHVIELFGPSRTLASFLWQVSLPSVSLSSALRDVVSSPSTASTRISSAAR